MSERRVTVLHLAPHPDDESIGAVATLMALVGAGHEVINVACSLGRPEQVDRRRREVRAACWRAGFELDELPELDRPLGISLGDDLQAAERTLTAAVGERIADRGVDVVVAPSPHDGHHGHEVVGRAARNAVAECGEPGPRLWMWGLWADLPWPTLYVGFDEDLLDAAIYVLRAHQGEIARNDYGELVRGRARANRSVGSERVFGFGAGMLPEPFAELLTEAQLRGGEWWAGAGRLLDATEPFSAGHPRDARADRLRPHPLGWWLYEESFGDRMRSKAAASASATTR